MSLISENQCQTQRLSQRLFFALWPSAEVRQQLNFVQSKVEAPASARRIEPDNFHITLHFLGSTKTTVRDCLVREASKISCARFELQINRLGLFKKAKIAWIGPEMVTSSLAKLHAQLYTVIEDCGGRVEDRLYRPHVSLLRKATASQPLEFTGISWPVSDFVLVESVTCQEGVRYHVIQRFPLTDYSV